LRIPVIIDTDPGMDDAVAIFLALSTEKLDVRALTTVAGNISLAINSKNALDLVSYAGRDTKVSRGADKPLLKPLETAEWVHGEKGLGSAKLPDSPSTFYEKSAWDTIYEESQSCNGELQLICLGPLTNIAITLIKYPDIKEKIKGITIMGGSCYLGNTTPSAEFNIYVDPEAADIVFKSGIPITMVGLDATHKSQINEREIEDILSIRNKISEAMEGLLYSNLSFRKEFSGLEGAIIHDAVAVAAVIEPTLIKKESYYVVVEILGELTYGRTVVDINRVTNNTPNTDVALDIDRERFVQILKGMMESYV